LRGLLYYYKDVYVHTVQGVQYWGLGVLPICKV